MKHKLINLTIIILIAINTASCSVVRFVKTYNGVHVKKTSHIEKRRGQLSRSDFHLQFDRIGNDLSFHLQYQPYYKAERREIVTYISQYSEKKNVDELLLFTLEVLSLIVAFGENMVETGELATNDQGELYNVTEFDWSGADPWAKAIIIGVPVDWLFWWVAMITERTVSHPWEQTGEIPGEWKSVENRPLSMDLSLPQFQYRYQDTYHTDSNGRFAIPGGELIGKIPNLEPALRTNSIKINASTTVDGQKQQDSFTIARFREGRRDPLFALFRDQAALRREKPADLVTEVTFSDTDDFIPNNILDAGEGQGKLEITIKNKGQGPGIDVQLNLSSDNPDIQFSKTRTLGRIAPNGEQTVIVPITTSLQANDGVATILVEAKERRGHDAYKEISITVARLKPPRLTITAVEVNDKTLGNTDGNGNGIVENDETIELNVFVKNSGIGDALGAKLELVSLSPEPDVQVRLANLGTIHPAETVRGILRFHIPRTFAAEALNYELRVTEMRGADSTEKEDVLRVETQRPILTYDISPPSGLTNGASASFTITPRNVGKLEARSVKLRLSAGNATIAPTSVDIGALESGKAHPPQPFKVTLPRTFKASQLSLNIQLSQMEFDGLSKTETFPVRQIAPSLEITDTLVDDTNGDGKIQQGEKVEFEVRVTNDGELGAENVRLKVSVTDNRIRIEMPERTLGKLGPNSTSNPDRFTFTLPRAVPAGALPISVEVTHRDFPSVEWTLEYRVHAIDIETTTVTPNRPTVQPQIPTTTANEPPIILLIPPHPDVQTIHSSNFILEASVSDDGGLDGVQARLNDERIYDSQTAPGAAQQLQAANRRILSFKESLQLREGKNSILITARDNDQERSERRISLIYEKKAVEFGLANPSDVDVDIPQGRAKNKYALALVIGIEDYRDIADATFADRDAIAFREYLIKTFGYSEDRIFLRTNVHATRSGIEGDLMKVADRLVPDRQSDVIVFYSGHGTVQMEGERAVHYLVPHEAELDNFTVYGYPLNEFYQKLAQLPAKSVTVFIDACFSGTGREAKSLVEGIKSLALPTMELPKSPGPVLASSASNQTSFSYESKRHGLFTYYLLKGLRGEADGADDSKRNGEITLNELEAYTNKHVSKIAREERGRPQEPNLTGGGEAKFLLRVE